EHPLSEHLRLSGTIYVRTNRTHTVNGDQRAWAQCTQTPGALCSTDDDGNEVPVRDRAGMPAAFDDAYDAAQNRTATRQTSYGATAQLTTDAPIAGRENHLFVGADVGQGRIRFRSQTTVGTL